MVIVGAGFAGLRAARALKGVDARVTVVDRSNHHLFQPLLYQVATAGLSPADIAYPIRGALRRQGNTEVVLGEVVGVDLERREVRVQEKGLKVTESRLPYDALVIATGATHSYFGNEAWAKEAPGLKSIADATEIRKRILLAFERAEMSEDPEERRKLLTFVLVGAGPTGVELAGSIAELAQVALARDFRHINPGSARILLIEANARVLKTFPEALSEEALHSLQKLGVEVRLGCRVSRVSSEGVEIGSEKIPSATVLWSAGVKASPAGEWLQADTDGAGRVRVRPDLSIPGHPEVFVIGDTAATPRDPENPKAADTLPGVAPVAMQQGAWVGRRIARAVKERRSLNLFPPDSRSAPEVFRYLDKGSLATIGRSLAVADLRGLHLSGTVAWVAWLFIHVLYLVGFRNRLLVLFQWLWGYVTFQRGTRIISD